VSPRLIAAYALLATLELWVGAAARPVPLWEPLVIESHAGLKGHPASAGVGLAVCVGQWSGEEYRVPITRAQIGALRADDPCPLDPRW